MTRRKKSGLSLWDDSPKRKTRERKGFSGLENLFVDKKRKGKRKGGGWEKYWTSTREKKGKRKGGGWEKYWTSDSDKKSKSKSKRGGSWGSIGNGMDRLFGTDRPNENAIAFVRLANTLGADISDEERQEIYRRSSFDSNMSNLLNTSGGQRVEAILQNAKPSDVDDHEKWIGAILNEYKESLNTKDGFTKEMLSDDIKNLLGGKSVRQAGQYTRDLIDESERERRAEERAALISQIVFDSGSTDKKFIREELKRRLEARSEQQRGQIDREENREKAINQFLRFIGLAD